MLQSFYFSFFFEGFGIPPLEALSVGAKIIVAKSSCLPEIFGDSAYYINPYKTNVYLDNVLNRPRQSGEVILQKYCFRSLQRLYSIVWKIWLRKGDRTYYIELM